MPENLKITLEKSIKSRISKKLFFPIFPKNMENFMEIFPKNLSGKFRTLLYIIDISFRISDDLSAIHNVVC